MHGIKRDAFFIISLNWVDVLTLAGLLTACTGLVYAYQGSISLAIALMLIAMFIDMIDGMIARRLRLESEFGRFLDSFCDVFIYLVLPLFILYQMGMQSPLSLIVLFSFLTAGLLRLSLFNIIGTVEEKGVAYHQGLQVIWSHLVVVLAFPGLFWLQNGTHTALLAILPAISLLMISNWRFPKPIWYKTQAFILISVTAAYVYLHLVGIHTP